MRSDRRIKLLHKLAQTTSVPPIDSSKTSVSGSPPVFDVIAIYPTITLGLNVRNIPILSSLMNALNAGLYYSSNGKVHLPWMRSLNFNFDYSSAASVDLKNLMIFSKMVFQLLLNNGNPYTQALTPEQIKAKTDTLAASQPLNNLSATNASSQLAAQIGGNLKTLILTRLAQIK